MISWGPRFQMKLRRRNNIGAAAARSGPQRCSAEGRRRLLSQLEVHVQFEVSFQNTNSDQLERFELLPVTVVFGDFKKMAVRPLRVSLTRHWQGPGPGPRPGPGLGGPQLEQ